MTFTRITGPDEFSLRDDGRTVEGRIVPYSDVTTVVDWHPVSGKVEQFREQFLPASFVSAVQLAERRGNAGFISLNLEHNESIREGRIGYATTLTEKDDGAYATFRLYERDDIRQVQSMLRESHTGLSVKFADIRAPHIRGDLVSHVQVAIEHVAATPIPAYANAGILALRDGVEDDGLVTQMDAGRPNLDAVRQWLAEMRQS